MAGLNVWCLCLLLTSVVPDTSGMLFPDLPSVLWGDDGTECSIEGRTFQRALNNLTLWAYTMWESSARSETGMLRGSTHQLGSFDECMHVSGPFKTQYCLVEVKMNVPSLKKPREKYETYYDPEGSVFVKLYDTGDRSRIPRNAAVMGLCTPASCRDGDIQRMLREHVEEDVNGKHPYNLTFDVQVVPDTCQNGEDEKVLDWADVAFCVLLLVIFVIVAICTIIDMKHRDDFKVKPHSTPLSTQLYLCFSARKNFWDLTKADDSNEALNILYGMRTIAILMIIMDHRFGTYITGPIINREYVEEQYRSFASLFIFHGDLFVDSFFVLSGLLVTYNLLVAFEKRNPPAWLIILNRYLRLTPIFAIVIFFYSTLLYKTGSGPLWKQIVGGMSNDCKNNWWASILYISNYVNDANMCMVHSWFLPCDFHYFILAIPTIHFIRRKPMAGIGFLFAILIIAILIPFGVTIIYQRPALLNFYIDFLAAPKIHPDFRMTYTKSHTRISAYIIGMFTGYVYYKLRNSSVKLSLLKSNVLTIIGLLLLFGGMASGGVFYDTHHPYNALEAGLYAGLHRPAWALGSAILILNASYGHIGIMRSVLEWKPWIPLSKLVYGAYLIHMCWQLRSTAMVRSPRYATFFDIFTLALGDMVFSFMLALMLYLMVETPFRKMFRVLMTPKRQEGKEDVKEGVNVERTVINVANSTEDSQM